MVVCLSGLLVAIGCGFGTPTPIGGAGLAFVQEPVGLEIEEAVRTLRARKLSWDDKADAMETLLASGPEGCAELAKHLTKVSQKLNASFLKDRGRLEQDFEKTAGRLAESRLDKSTLKRIDELRATWLAASRAKGLTKTQVQEICDAAQADIQQILDVEVEQVWDASPKLESRWAELVLELDDLLYLHDFLAAAREVLLSSGKAWAGKSYVKKTPTDPTQYEESALRMLDRLARLATVMPEKDRNTILANEADLVQLEAEEAAGILEVNRIRVRAGLAALRVDLKLCTAGRGHSQDMVEHGFFAHESPLPGKKNPGDRAALAGTSGGAENIAAGQQTGLDAIQAWWYSPGHHRNMMGSHGRIGLGRHQGHWTQMFG